MNNFDKYIKDRLEHAHMQPGDKVWEKIAASGAIGSHKPVILPLYRKLAVAAALFIGVCTIAFFWLKEDHKSGNIIIADEVLETPFEDGTGTPVIEEGKDTEKGSASQDKPEESENKTLQPGKTQKKLSPSQFEGQDNIRRRKKSIGNTPLLHERQMSHLAYQPVQTLPVRKAPLQSDQSLNFNEAIANQIYRTNKFDLESSSLLRIDPDDLLRLAEAEYAPIDSKESETLKDKLFQFAGDRLNAFADAAGLPWRKISKVSELEILY